MAYPSTVKINYIKDFHINIHTYIHTCTNNYKQTTHSIPLHTIDIIFGFQILVKGILFVVVGFVMFNMSKYWISAVINTRFTDRINMIHLKFDQYIYNYM